MKIKLPLQMLDGVTAYFRVANMDQTTGDITLIEHRITQSRWESMGRPTLTEIEVSDSDLDTVRGPDDIEWT